MKETLLKRLQEEKEMQLKGGLYHKTQVAFAYNSNRIEGSRLTEDQTRCIFETNTILHETEEPLRVDDIVETVNHFRCFDYLLDYGAEHLTEGMVKEFHRILKSGTGYFIRKKLYLVGIFMVFLFSLSACAKEESAPPPPVSGKAPDRTTDTWSTAFENKEDKLNFLKEYLDLPTEPLDVEYHIVYNDNSPGGAEWDILAVFKVNPEDMPLWSEGMRKLLPGHIDVTMWDDLRSEGTGWREEWEEWIYEEEAWWERWGEWADSYKHPTENSYLVTYPYSEKGLVLKRVSTTYLPDPLTTPPVFEDEVPGFDEYKELVAEKLGYDVSAAPYIETSQVEIGILEAETMATVVMFKANFYDGRISHNSVLMVITNADDGSADNIFCKPLIEGGSWYSFCYLADIDGNGSDEILTHHELGGLGGAGYHDTRIYKFTDEDLKCIFSYHDESDHSRDFDTGFTLTLSDGWTYTIKNRYTDFSTSFTQRESATSYFDEQGNITEDAEENNQDSWLGVDSFFNFEPVDIDGDGIFEIRTGQYTFLSGTGHMNGIGDAYTILKWNQNDGVLNVIEAGFWQYEDYEEEEREEYFRRGQEYEDNWYKDN